MLDKEEILQTLRELKDEINSDYKADIAGLFGSFARDEATEESDIDILAKFKKGASYFDLVGMSQFLEEKFNRKVDVVSVRGLRKELENYVYQDLIKL
jgi:predicted nucleotidyltransferase